MYYCQRSVYQIEGQTYGQPIKAGHFDVESKK